MLFRSNSADGKEKTFILLKISLPGLILLTSCYLMLSVELVSNIKPGREIFSSIKVFSFPSAELGGVDDPANSFVSNEDSMQEEFLWQL